MEVATNTNRKKHGRLRLTPWKIITLALILAFVLTILFTFIYVSGNERIFPNISVAGVDVGGLSVSEAANLLEQEFGNSLDYKTVTITSDDVSVTHSGEDLGIRVDFEQSALDAFEVGRNRNGIFSRVGEYIGARFSERNIPLNVSAHDDTIERVILEITRGREVAPIQPSFEIANNQLTLRRGTHGYVVNRTVARDEIERTFGLVLNENIAFNIEYVAAAEFGLSELYAELTSAPIDAFFERDEDNRIVIVPEQPQAIISREDLAQALNSDSEVITLSVGTIYPDVTRNVLENRLFSDVLASYTTFFNGNEIARSSNVRLSASRVDGHEMMPGDEFSFDLLVGPRTAQHGFQPANVFINNRIEVGFGGGICQPSSTIYVAALYADLEITERHNHSLPVGYIRAGLDATIVRGVLDLRFLNNTEYPIKVVATTTFNSITIQILGTQTVENRVVTLNNFTTGGRAFNVLTEHSADVPVGTRRVSQSGSNGFSVRSYRIVTVNGVEVRREFLHNSVYNPMDRIYLVNPADANRDWSLPADDTYTPTEYDDDNIIRDEPDVRPSLDSDEITEIYVPSPEPETTSTPTQTLTPEQIDASFAAERS